MRHVLVWRRHRACAGTCDLRLQQLYGIKVAHLELRDDETRHESSADCVYGNGNRAILAFAVISSFLTKARRQSGSRGKANRRRRRRCQCNKDGCLRQRDKADSGRSQLCEDSSLAESKAKLRLY